MTVYQITYDLRKQRDDQSLHQRIKAYQTWCHPLESTWLVATNQSTVQVRDYLLGAIDRDDGLLVNKLGCDGAWYGLPKDVSDWLHAQLASCTL